MAFTESRAFAISKNPLQQNGTLRSSQENGLSLSYEGAKPHIIIVDDKGLIDRVPGGHERQVTVADHPELSTLTDLYLNLLRGNADKLFSYADVYFTGNDHTWQMGLSPHDAALEKRVGKVVISGGGRDIQAHRKRAAGRRFAHAGVPAAGAQPEVHAGGSADVFPGAELSREPSSGQTATAAPWRATGLLLCFLLVGLGVLYAQHASKRVSVDVLELLPRDEQDATIRLARQTVTGRFGRTLLLALADPAHPDKPPTQAAARMAAELRDSGVFADAFAGLTAEGKDRLQGWFLARRLPLRLPVWFDAMRARWRKEKGPSAPADPDPGWLASTADADLQEFQNTSDALAYQERLPTDPLLLIPGLLNVFGDDDKSTAGDVAGGALTATGPDGVHYALLNAEIKGSPLDERGQQPVFDAINRAFARAGGGLTLRWTGVSKFAADARTRLVHENSVLTYISLAISGALMLAAFRRVSVFVYLALPILTATVWSLVVCFALFERVHLMTIIFTTVLVGVALDYGIYTLIHAQRTDGGIARALRDIRRPLIAGCLTSVGGFVFMTLTTLPMLRQMGVAVALGLIFSLTLDFLYLPWVPAFRQTGEPRGVDRQARRLALGGWRYPLFATGLAVAAAGLVFAARIRWSDDVRTLQAMSPELQNEQTFLRTLFGQSKDQHIILTFGPDLNAAFASLEKFNAALTAASTAPADRFFNLGKLLPTAGQSAACRDYFRAHPEFTAALRAAPRQGFQRGARSTLSGAIGTRGCGPSTPPVPRPRPPICSPACAKCCRCRCKTSGTTNKPARAGSPRG